MGHDTLNALRDRFGPRATSVAAATGILAQVQRLHEVRPLTTSPTAATAAYLAKLDLTSAIQVASAPDADPQLLATLAKRSQKTLRRVVVVNARTPRDAVQLIADKAARERDIETIDLSARYSDPLTWIATVGQLRGLNGEPVNRVIDPLLDNLAERDADTCLRAFAFPLRGLRLRLAARAATPEFPVTFSQLLKAATAAGTGGDWTWSIVNAASGVTDDAWDAWATWVATQPADAHAHHGTALHQTRTISRHGVRTVLEAGRPEMLPLLVKSAAWGEICDGQPTADELEELATQVLAMLKARTRKYDTDCASILLSSRHVGLLSSATVAALAEARSKDEGRTKALREHMLTAPAMPFAHHVEILSYLGAPSVQDWLCGRHATRPTRAQLEEIATRKDRASFTAHMHHGMQHRSRPPEDLPAAHQLLWEHAMLLGQWRDEPALEALMEEMVTAVVDIAAHGQSETYSAGPSEMAVEWLMHRLQQELGEHEQSWRVACDILADAHTGTLAELVTMIKIVGGHPDLLIAPEPEVQPEPQPPASHEPLERELAPMVPGTHYQLSLLG